MGYSVNKLFELGITGKYRSKFNAEKSKLRKQDEVYGYGVFLSHMGFKNFFIYLEGERIRTTFFNLEDPKRQWQQTLLIGAGRKFKVSKWLEMQTLILFNVLHDNKSGVYNSPVVFKSGFRFR